MASVAKLSHAERAVIPCGAIANMYVFYKDIMGKVLIFSLPHSVPMYACLSHLRVKISCLMQLGTKIVPHVPPDSPSEIICHSHIKTSPRLVNKLPCILII